MIRRIESGARMSQAVVAQGFVSPAGQVAADTFARRRGTDGAENRAWDRWVAADPKPARATIEAALAAPEYRVESRWSRYPRVADRVSGARGSRRGLRRRRTQRVGPLGREHAVVDPLALATRRTHQLRL